MEAGSCNRDSIRGGGEGSYSFAFLHLWQSLSTICSQHSTRASRQLWNGMWGWVSEGRWLSSVCLAPVLSQSKLIKRKSCRLSHVVPNSVYAQHRYRIEQVQKGVTQCWRKSSDGGTNQVILGLSCSIWWESNNWMWPAFSAKLKINISKC